MLTPKRKSELVEHLRSIGLPTDPSEAGAMAHSAGWTDVKGWLSAKSDTISAGLYLQAVEEGVEPPEGLERGASSFWLHLCGQHDAALRAAGSAPAFLANLLAEGGPTEEGAKRVSLAQASAKPTEPCESVRHSTHFRPPTTL